MSSSWRPSVEILNYGSIMKTQMNQTRGRESVFLSLPRLVAPTPSETTYLKTMLTTEWMRHPDAKVLGGNADGHHGPRPQARSASPRSFTRIMDSATAPRVDDGAAIQTTNQCEAITSSNAVMTRITVTRTRIADSESRNTAQIDHLACTSGGSQWRRRETPSRTARDK
jgi:hypothetical protein